MAIRMVEDINESYIYVSYSRSDKERVEPVLEKLSGQGYRLWYDNSVSTENVWMDQIVYHMDNCELSIVFISESSAYSYYCKNEIIYLSESQKRIIPVLLDPSGLPLIFECYLGEYREIEGDELSAEEIAQEIMKVGAVSECKAEKVGSKDFYYDILLKWSNTG